MIPSTSPDTTTAQPVKRLRRRPLTIREILAWADHYREATGKWPTKETTAWADGRFETWLSIDNALRLGLRALPGGSSLARLLAERRGFRNTHDLPPLNVEQILTWADAFHAKCGTWPSKKSGPIPDTKGETWLLIDGALRQGVRGLARSSLPKLLAAHRGVRNRKQLSRFTEEQILAWADAHHARVGAWPTAKSGSIQGAPGETWMAVQVALRQGRRGLPGGSSLPLLLAENRGVRNVWSLPNLSVPEILRWADAFHERTGGWPNQESGPIQDAPGETWMAVDMALKHGSRGLTRSS